MNVKEIEKQGGTLDAKNINYKIGLDNAPEKVKQQLKLGDLQRRITNLEKIFGNTGKHFLGNISATTIYNRLR